MNNFLKQLVVVAFLASPVLASTAVAQAGDNAAESKRGLAERIVKAQQGPEFERLLQQMANSTTPRLIDQFGPRLDQLAPGAKRDAARQQLTDALTGYVSDVTALLKTRAQGLTNKTLVPLYEERFSLEELRTLANFFESDANRKYQAAAPEFGQKLVQALVQDSTKAVEERGNVFGKKAEEILVKSGAPAASAAPAGPAAASSAPKKK